MNGIFPPFFVATGEAETFHWIPFFISIVRVGTATMLLFMYVQLAFPQSEINLIFT